MRDAEEPDAEGARTYPPERSTWEFSPRQTSARWMWLAALAAVTGLIAAGALVAVVVAAGSGDLPGVIDDDELLAAIAVECSLMTSTVDALPMAGTAQQQSDTIRDQDRAIRLMVDAIRTDAATEIIRDRPSEQWLDDWDQLVVARERLARQLLRDPNAFLTVPVDRRGDPVAKRMDDVWLGDAVCKVPATISAPDSDALSG